MSSSDLQFEDSKPDPSAAGGGGGGDKIVDGVQVATDSAWDPENPTSEILAAAPTMPEDASFFQRVSYYFAVVKHFKDRKLQSLRPWKEFADRDEFAIPGKLEALGRISENVQYFNSNYVALVSVMSIYILMAVVLIFRPRGLFQAYG